MDELWFQASVKGMSSLRSLITCNIISLKPCLSHGALVCMYIVYIYNLYVHHTSFIGGAIVVWL